MRRYLSALAVALVALSGAARVHSAISNVSVPVVLGWDLNGAAATSTSIVNATTIVDSTDYTAAVTQPDSCRAITATVTDANGSISAGSATVVGTGADGEYLTATIDLTDQGSTQELGTFCSIVSISNAVVTGEGGAADTLSLGYSGAPEFQYAVARGPSADVSASGTNPDDAFTPRAVEQWYSPSGLIKTASVGTTAVVSYTSSSSALLPVDVGDIITFNDRSNRPVYAAVIAKTDDDTITLDRAADLTQTGGAKYRFRRFANRSGYRSGFFAVDQSDYTTVFINVSQYTASSGSIDIQVECIPGAGPTLGTASVLASSNIGGAGVFAVAIPEPWAFCRVGAKFDTGDDADASAGAKELINVYVVRREIK